MKRRARTLIELFQETLKEWQEDKASRLGAALAYYTIFSVAPLLLIAIVMAGLIFGQAAAQGQIVTLIQEQVGAEAAESIQAMISSISKSNTSVIATVIAIVTVLVGASNFFNQLKDALNTIWNVTPKRGRGVRGIVQDRLLALAMVLFIGFLLIASLIASTVVSAASSFFEDALPGSALLWQLIGAAISFGIVTLLFAMIFKILPDVEIAWSDVWIGAAVTSLLFTIGTFLIGLYLGRSSVSSIFGAAGSLVVILLWVYYSALILLFGAEFTEVYANKYGSQVVPAQHAVRTRKARHSEPQIPVSLDNTPQDSDAHIEREVATLKRQRVLVAILGAVGGVLAGIAGLLLGASRRDK